MQLQDIPTMSKLRVTNMEGEVVDAVFSHLDGMYSYCYIDDDTASPDKVFHLSRFTPMRKVEDHTNGDYYEIDNQE